MTTSRREFHQGHRRHRRGLRAVLARSRRRAHRERAERPSARVEVQGHGRHRARRGEVAGSSYADIRFTMTTNPPGAMVNYPRRWRGGRRAADAGWRRRVVAVAVVAAVGEAAVAVARGGGGAFKRDSDRRRTLTRPASACASCTAACGDSRRARSSPRTRSSASRASRWKSPRRARSRRRPNLKLAQVPTYVENYVTPMTKPPLSVSQTDKQAWAQSIVDKAKGVKGVTAVNVTRESRLRVALLRVERRQLHRAGALHDDAEPERHGQGRRRHAHAKLPRRRGDGRLGSRRADRFPRRRRSVSRTKRSRCAPPSRSARAGCAISFCRRRTRC